MDQLSNSCFSGLSLRKVHYNISIASDYCPGRRAPRKQGRDCFSHAVGPEKQGRYYFSHAVGAEKQGRYYFFLAVLWTPRKWSCSYFFHAVGPEKAGPLMFFPCCAIQN